MAMEIRSRDFDKNQSIPKKFTCEGSDTSPSLSWSGAPAGTRSVALVVDDPDAPDPDAPKRTFVHWVLFNLPPEGELAEGAGKNGSLPRGCKAGKNDWNHTEYGGPCPPIGRHRYFFKLYALDTTLDLQSPTKAELERAMEGHILARAELIGTYKKEHA